nr:disheveled-associated activator of morphogenesis 1 [Danaus plexippus plexippus]
MCSKDQINHILGKINVGLPSWSRGLEAAEAARVRLFRWACGEANDEPPRKKMPHALRRRWPMCPCLQNDEPPEITYCVVGGEGGLALQAVTPTHPMPPQDELDAKFAELVEELDLTAVNKAAMMELPAAKKWQIYCSRRPPPGQAPPLATAPQVEEYIKALNEISDAFASSENAPPSEATGLVDGLKTALRTRAHSFVLRFIKQGGLAALLEALQRAPRDDAITRHNLIAGIKALMNNSTGRAHVLAHPTSIDLIAQSMDTENVKTKVAALEILGAVCLVPGGHKKVLEAMIHYQKYAGERARFQGIVNELDRSTGAYRDDLGLKTAIMSFVNAVLNYGPGEESLEFRLHLRYELLMLGIQPVIEKLRKYENETLDRHIEFFELVRCEDERELGRRYEHTHVDTKSAAAMFELLRRKLSHTAAYGHLLSLLQHLLLLPLEYNPHSQHWLLLDRVVQQIVLQAPGRDGSDSKVYNPDVAPLEINVGEIVQLLAKEEELVAARNKADNLERENVDLATELAKKEKQVDQHTQEKEELEGVVSRAGPPPAPAPPRPKKNVPTPGNPLKSFNWSKLPDAKLHGTIWQELDDTKLYNAMDLNAIDKMFCAYQKNGVQNEGSVEDLRQLGSKPRSKILSVIDGRRAQNCTILLSKLKMTDEEICRAILRMDSGEQLPLDMLEQLLKFTPSAEEAALLEEHQDELDSMARADRFLYEISKIPHYSQRVRTLLFKKKFSLAVSEASSRASVVLRAARDMTRSRRLRALLEIVLALGNYMNRGARGNASGFRLTSLNKLADTKSSVTRNTTLLHYLVEMLETQFKDVLLLEEDLPHVRAAAKVCVDQLEKDVGSLRTGLREVSRELDYHASLLSSQPHDAFVPVMREFHAHAVCSFTQLEDLFQDMKSRLEACAHAFGEEPSTSPEQLFGALDSFLTQLAEARAECDAARRRRDEEERRTRHEQELKKRTMERKQGSSLLGSVGKSLGKTNGDCNGHDASRDGTLTNGQKGEFDDLISALRTGDVFGDDVAKFKRSRKAKARGRDSPPRPVCREDSRERQKN